MDCWSWWDRNVMWHGCTDIEACRIDWPGWWGYKAAFARQVFRSVSVYRKIYSRCDDRRWMICWTALSTMQWDSGDGLERALPCRIDRVLAAVLRRPEMETWCYGCRFLEHEQCFESEAQVFRTCSCFAEHPSSENQMLLTSCSRNAVKMSCQDQDSVGIDR